MEEDQKQEASTMAANSNPSTRPNSKSSGITQDQLSKFRELQRRRLQIKSKAKTKRRPRGQSDGNGKKCLDEDHVDENNTVQELKDSSFSGSSSSKSEKKNETSTLSVQVYVHPALKKKKLHWGLDTKERWERKANM